jgi:hypothetical protein
MILTIYWHGSPCLAADAALGGVNGTLATQISAPSLVPWHPPVLAQGVPTLMAVTPVNLSETVSTLPAPGAPMLQASLEVPHGAARPALLSVMMPPMLTTSPAQVSQQPSPATGIGAPINRPSATASIQPTLTFAGLSTSGVQSTVVSPVIIWPPPWPPAGQTQVILPPAAINGVPSLASTSQIGY